MIHAWLNARLTLIIKCMGHDMYELHVYGHMAYICITSGLGNQHPKQ